MMRLCYVLLAALALSACVDQAPAPPPVVATPFTAEDNAVPVALDPNRPQPPAPTHFDVARDEERVPPPEH